MIYPPVQILSDFRSRMEKVHPLLLDITSGILLGLAQHPIHLGFLAWFALVPWLFRLQKTRSVPGVLGSSFLFGFTYYLVDVYWLAFNIGTEPPTRVISMLASVVFLSHQFLLAAGLYLLVRRRLWTLPFIWTAVEYLRSFTSLAFPWGAVANTQIDYLPVIQIAEYTGYYGVSFLIVWINISLYRFLMLQHRQTLVHFAGVIMLPWLLGLLILSQAPEPKGNPVSVAVIQPNIHLSQKWNKEKKESNINLMLDMGMPAVDEKYNLIIWPETAPASYLFRGSRRYLLEIRRRLADSGTRLVTGVPHYEWLGGERFNYNSVAMISSDGLEKIYHKILLVPMAEYIPLSNIFPKLKRLNLGQANFTHGTEFTLFDTDSLQFGTGVCFESTFAQFSREYVNRGADFLIYVVNDGWYETAPEPQQHARQCVFRAVETRKPIVRCANTGISLVVNSYGNIVEELPLNARSVIQTSIQTNPYKTFYTRFGDLFSWMNIVVILAAIIKGIIKRK